jgi:WD40 repeat protein/formylglycine-generating enzyme required for sulfatase activity
MLQVLGRGGFGIVFRAFDDILQRVVAVKVMAPQIATLSPARKRFTREAQSSAKVRHENVVQIYEVGEQPLPYLVMEFVPGETLQQKLDRCGPLDVPETLRIGRQIAEGLAAAHACDLIHRDIKPGNILLEGGSHKAKITDFGLARAADDASISQSGIIAGTPMFMSPEQALGHTIDQRADLFSLGSVLYQMASGRPPFRAPTALAVLKRVAEEAPRPIPEIIPETPDWLCGIVAKLHAKDPNDRFQSAREVADLLADCEAKLKAKQEVKNILPAAAKPPAPTSSAGRKWVAAAAILLLPLIALAVTEFAAVTHLFRGQQGTFDTNKSGNDLRAEAPPPALAPFDAAQARAHQEAWAKYLGVPVESTNSIGMKLRLIPSGKFMMGSSKEEIEFSLKLNADDWVKDFLPGEGPQHEVEITQPFYLGQTEVTVEQFRRFVKATGYKTQAEREGGSYRFVNRKKELDENTNWLNPGFVQTDDHPVVCVSWHDAAEFCNWLSKQEGKNYRLPTEAEWEYGCRAGSKGLWSFGGYNAQLLNYARFGSNSQGHTWPVAGLKENAWSLHDMHGNAWEWCQDVYDANYYKTGPAKDPPGSDAGADRVLRGGSFTDPPVPCRSAFRLHHKPSERTLNIGFRVALVGDLKAKAPVLVEKPEPLPPTFKNSLGMEFVVVPKGKSWLGGGKDLLGDKEVVIPADFYLGKYEVTQEEWVKVMDDNPSFYSRNGGGKDKVADISDADLKRFPVENVSWDDCQLFLERLNQREKETGWVYRLPNEVEWEYACRGGPMSDKMESAFDFYFAKPTNTLLPDQANFNTGTTKKRMGLLRSRKVGSYEANRLGLYDMHGNVSEWCDDIAKTVDGALLGVYRGRGHGTVAEECRAADRSPRQPSRRHGELGLRVARVPVGAKKSRAGVSANDPVPAEKVGEVRRFEGHLGVVRGVAFTLPDGRHALSGSWDRTVRLWDVATGKEVKRLLGHQSIIIGVAVSRDGRFAASAGHDLVRVWDLKEGTEAGQFPHGGGVNAVAFSPDGRHLLSAGWDKVVRLWDRETGKELKTLMGHTKPISFVAFLPNTDEAVSAGEDGTWLWDLKTGNDVRQFAGISVAVAPDGLRLVTGDLEGVVRLWDVKTGAELHRFEGHKGFVSAVAFSPDGRRLLSCGEDKTVRLWDAETGHQAHRFDGHTTVVWGVAFSPDGRYALSGGGEDRTARLWRLPDLPPATAIVQKFQGHTIRIRGVALSGDGKYVLTGSEDRTAILWEVASGKKIQTFKGHTSLVTSAALSGDGKRVVTGSFDKTAILWDADSGARIQTFKGHTDNVLGVAVSGDGGRVLTGSSDMTAILWDAASGKKIKTFQGHGPNGVTSVALSGDGNRVLTGSMDKTAILWDANSGTKIQTFKGHTGHLQSVALSGDGKRVLTGAHDNTAILWHADSGEKIHTFAGHASPVWSVALSGDGKRAITGSLDMTAILWDATSGKKIQTFAGHTDEILGVALSSDGNLVVTGSADKTAILWEVKATTRVP